MNVMIDTNVILDDILSRGANAEAARKISRFVTDGFITGYLTANCLTDIFYIVSKNRDETIARKMILSNKVTVSLATVIEYALSHFVSHHF